MPLPKPDHCRVVAQQISQCELCAEQLPLPPTPLVQFGGAARILVIGQAPGKLAHQHQKLWSDPSGDRLRLWLQLSTEQFYNPDLVALVSMAFCYPGKAGSGDKAPPAVCSERWHHKVLPLLQPKLTLLVGRYAQQKYLPEYGQLTLTELIQQQPATGRNILALPHPSPRNNIWLSKNPWFEEVTLPLIRQKITASLMETD